MKKLFLASIILTICALICMKVSQNRVFLFGHDYFQLQTVVSILEDGDIDLKNQLNFDVDSILDEIAGGKNGEWYPLHEIPLAILAIPFYKLFGVIGLLYLNILIVVTTFLLLIEWTRGIEDLFSTTVSIFIVLMSSSLYFYVFEFSSDLLASVFLSISLLSIVRNHCFVSGLCAGLAFLTRNHLGPSLLTFYLYLIVSSRKDRFKNLCNLSLGIFPSVLMFGIYNLKLFGSPFSSTYSNWILFEDGELKKFAQEQMFSMSYIVGNLESLVWDNITGFATVNFLPILIALVATITSNNRSRDEFKLMALSIIPTVITIFFLSMRFTNFSGRGNRYVLFLPICLYPIIYCYIGHLRQSFIKYFKNDN